MMKRKKVSEGCSQNQTSTNEDAEAGQVEIQYSGCSIMDLPIHILADILFRLPIKEIIVCKCTCKSFYATISNPDFAKSEAFPIARTMDCTHVSRTLYPLELDERSIDQFSCHQRQDFSEIRQVSVKFDSKLKIPLRNFPLVFRDEIDSNFEITLSAKDHGYKLLNSCNGFICLSEPVHGKPAVVCNPITGEFINLPQVTNVVGYEYIDCGFGYSPKANQYKVVRIFELYSSPGGVIIGRLAQVHTLGTRSWKTIEFASYSAYVLSFPTYLNGSIHWFCHLEEKLSRMVSFDCEKECFLPFPLPPLVDPKRVNVGMGVLEGCLCMCDSSSLTSIGVWVMKNYGVEESWTKVFEIDMSCADRLLYGLYQPIKYLKNGALLMFNYPRSNLIYYDPRKLVLKLFEVHPISRFEILAYSPSFISLKDVLAGCNVEVLSVYSRGSSFDLKGEPSAFLV